MHSLKLISQNPLENFLKLVGNLQLKSSNIYNVLETFLMLCFCILK